MTLIRRMPRWCVVLAFGSLLALCAAAASGANPPDTQSSETPGGVKPDAVALIRRLVDGNGLRLSTEGAGATDRFHFVVRFMITARANDPVRSMTYLIARDGRRVAVLARTADDLAFGYMTSGFCVIFDPEHPGHLAMSDAGGAPAFVMEAGKDESGMAFQLGFARNTEETRVVLDIGSLLQAALRQLRAAKLEKGRVTLETEHSTIWLSVPSDLDHAAFPIDGFAMAGAGYAVSVAAIKPGFRPDQPVFEVTKTAVEGLKLPMAVVAKPSPKISLIAPPEFGESPAERAAAEKLGTLFRPREGNDVRR